MRHDKFIETKQEWNRNGNRGKKEEGGRIAQNSEVISSCIHNIQVVNLQKSCSTPSAQCFNSVVRLCST